MNPGFYLARNPTGDKIHRSGCSYLTIDAQRWRWADNHPHVDWLREYPWLEPCSRCKPPSPLITPVSP